MSSSTQVVAKRQGGKKQKQNDKVWFWSSECKYEVILSKVKEIGWKVVDDEKHEHCVLRRNFSCVF